jgi:hypothetical protein
VRIWPGAPLLAFRAGGGRLRVQDTFYEQSACSHSAADLPIAAPTARPGLYVLLPAASSSAPRSPPARRQCPRNCDARTAFSGRAEKKRRGSPGGFPRRLEADVQCSRSMHRNDRRSLKRLAENRQSRSSLLVSSLSLRRGRSRGRRAGAFETAWNKIPSFKSTCVVPKNTAIPHSISTSKKRRIYWLSEGRFREGYSVHPAVTSPSPSWTAPPLPWSRFPPRGSTCCHLPPQ